ncbi:AsmA family protein [Glaciimonas sp. PAMC28666]|uniref:AsmA family protein n=1 Tax=Glaciimonas sp. PAMC28666 TaxID=2807626 RepID=UPI00196470BD|nr:AsmA family protein [Glaciimonas sp. PAMC28666]QRX84236.1 AsmA family protein [Glaciimonas sp. PAMC28666]
MTTTGFRVLKIFYWCIGSLFIILGLCVIFLLVFDWNLARPWLNQRVSAAAGRPFAIRGNLSLDWFNPHAEENGWHKWIPWPQLTARDVVLDNPTWAKTGQHMVEVNQVTFTLRPLPLLEKNITIPSLQLDRPVVMLERSTDGKNNWTFPSSGPSQWNLNLQKLILTQGTIRLLDPIKKIDIDANIATLAQITKEGYGIGWSIKGSFNKAPVSGSGKAGAVLSLTDVNTPYPLEAGVKVGKTAIDVKGSLTKPSNLAALDLRLKLSATSMADLYPLTGIALPATPPFSTEGRLIGKLQSSGADWRYENFSGTVGASDLSGTIDYLAKDPRPLLKGTLVSNQLRLVDLGPLIGADSNASKARRGVAPTQPANKALPTEGFDTSRWGSIDADIKFTGKKIIRSEELPIQNLNANIHLNDRHLSLTPLNFGIAGGNLTSTIKLDGSVKPMKANVMLSARHLKINRLFPTLESARASLGEVNGDAALLGAGNSVATLLGTANGEVKMLVNQGTLSKFILEAAGLNVGNVVLTKLFGDKQVKLNCLASDFVVANGLMQTRTFLLDTDDAIITVSGRINLATEVMALNVKPKSKGLRIISFRSPLYVAGTFKNPDVGVDKGVLALKAGSAIALGVLFPVAAILPLVNIGSTQQTDCADLLAEVKLKAVVPPSR